MTLFSDSLAITSWLPASSPSYFLLFSYETKHVTGVQDASQDGKNDRITTLTRVHTVLPPFLYHLAASLA